MNCIYHNLVTIFIFMFVFLQNSLSQLQSSTSPGGFAGAPMRMGFGPRGIAMGNSLSAIINGDVQAYYNPAVIPFETAPTVMAAFGVLSLDRRLNFISYTQSVKPNAGIAFAIINAGVGDIDGRDRDGIHTDTYSTSENSFMFSFGLKPDNRISIGVTAKILYYSLYQEISSVTAAMDIGAVFLLTDEFVIGAVIQDINAKYKWDTSKLYGKLGNITTDRYPLRKRIGISWLSKNYPLTVSTEYEAIGSDSNIRIGSEIEIYEGVSFRTGLDQIALKSDLPTKLSLGIALQASIANQTPIFQYAFVVEPYSPSGIHIISFSMRFK